MAYEAQIYTVIVARLTPEVQDRLDALLVVSRASSSHSHDAPGRPRVSAYEGASPMPWSPY